MGQTAAPTRTRATAAQVLRAGRHGLFAILFVIGLTQTLTDGRPWPAAAAGIAMGAWYLLGIWLDATRPPAEVGWGWLAVLCGLWVVAVVHEPAFAWLVFALSLTAMHVLATVPGLLAVATLTSVAVAALWRTSDNPIGVVLGPVMGALVSIGITAGHRVLQAESAERGRLLDELTVAQADLVAVQEELATVQRESGALGERARLARDLHDTIAQGYSSILLLARAGLARGTADADLLTRIEATAADNLVEARRVVHALAPAQLQDAPLPAAVRRLLDRLADETGLEVALDVAGDPRLAGTDVDVAVLRLVQGALANVRQHAGARRVVVSLTYEPDELLVDVVDDGRGFDPARVVTAPDAGGFGLRAMRERIAALGGSLSVESTPGDGTAVAAAIPLEGGAR